MRSILQVKVSHGGQKVDVSKCQVSWAKRSGRSGGTALENGNDRQRRAEQDIWRVGWNQVHAGAGSTRYGMNWRCGKTSPQGGGKVQPVRDGAVTV